jgi:hypothetical protein
MAMNNVHISEDLLSKLRSKAAAEGKTVDELAEEALCRHLAQQTLDRLKREADRRRAQMTEVEVEQAVERAVSDVRTR